LRGRISLVIYKRGYRGRRTNMKILSLYFQPEEEGRKTKEKAFSFPIGLGRRS